MEYTTRLTGEALVLPEMQVTAELMASGMTKTETKNEILGKNLYHYEEETSMKKRFSFIWRRLNFINDGEGLKLFLSDVSNAKILALYTIFQDNNLFALVMDQVVSEKLKSLSSSLYKSDIIQLFEKLDPYEPTISQHTTQTRAKICQVILKILKEVGMLNDDRLTNLYIPFSVSNYLENKENGKEFLFIIS